MNHGMKCKKNPKLNDMKKKIRKLSMVPKSDPKLIDLKKKVRKKLENDNKILFAKI